MNIVFYSGVLFSFGGLFFDLYPAAQYIGLIALIVVAIFVSATERQFLIKINFLLILYVSLVVINLTGTDYAVDVGMRFFALSAVFWAAKKIVASQNDYFLCLGLIYASAPLLIIACLGAEMVDDALRRNFLNIHPNLIGMYAYVMGVLSFVIGLRPAKKVFFVALSIFVSIYFSSRASLLSFVVFLVLYGIFSNGKKLLKYSPLIIFCIFAMASVLSEVLMLNDEHRGINSGFSGRTDYWLYGVKLFLDNFYTGVGYGQAEKILQIPIDNGYILLLAELGIFGAAFFAYLIFDYIVLILTIKKFHSDEFCISLAFAFSFLVYLFFERRYMAFGNPLSLLGMIFYCKLNYLSFGGMKISRNYHG